MLGSSDILTDGEKEFFHSMKRLCEASVVTGNPIMFWEQSRHGFARIYRIDQTGELLSLAAAMVLDLYSPKSV